MREFAIALVLITAALFGWVLGSEADEIAFRDFAVLAGALIVIVSFQVLLLYGVSRILRKFAPNWQSSILLGVTSALLAANAYFFAFYTLELPTEYRVTCAVLAGAAFLILMSMPRARAFVCLFGAVMFLMSFGQYAFTRATLVGVDVTAETISLPINTKRNVYLIGFESLQSPNAYRQNYGIEKPPHVEFLKKLGFRVLDHAYSAERSTLRSYSRIFEFRRSTKQDDLGERSVFVNDNSTFRSFRDSGYNIQMLYKNNYFPVTPSNVTYAFPPPAFDACDEMGSYYFYGLCSKKVSEWINETILGSKKISWKPQIPLLRKRVDVVVKSGEPWFTWTHIKHPFHTHGYMRHPDPEYAAKFKRMVQDAMPVIADNMEKTVGYIVERDPGAVIVVIGDHGTHLFRGDEDKVRKAVYSGDPVWPMKAILEDQHGINFAVYPADFCVNRMSGPFSSRFLVENLIACLNGNDTPTEEERKRARTINFLGELSDTADLRAKAENLNGQTH